MLQTPHTHYERLWVYYLDRCDLPPIHDPDFIGTWIEDEHAILFFHQPKETLIKQICQAENISLIYEADLDYQDWEAGIPITSFSTKYLTVRPVWEGKSQNDEHIDLCLDPSVIFGSGFHPSTRLCLEVLELVLCQSGAKIETMLDLGTGTGLLAIAAAKLGCKKVQAVDNNPLAVRVALANVQRNDCSSVVSVAQADLLDKLPETECDLIVANLYKGLLVKLLEDPLFWQAKMYMLSGFMPGMEAELLAALGERKVQILHRGNSGPWRLWLLQEAAG